MGWLTRGAVCLADLNPPSGTEPGKTRPCLVVQSDLLSEAGHPSTTVLPLTSRVVDDAAPLRVTISARDGLQVDSQVLIDQIRTIDNRRFTGGALTLLTEREMAQVEEFLAIVLGFRN